MLCFCVAVKIIAHKNPVEIAIVTTEMSPECGAGSNY